MVLRREYRIVLPLTVEEYQVAQLWAVAEASKNETGGGEGIEVVENRPYTKDTESGQYTYKIYHLKYKVPGYIRALAPKGALEMVEEAWNAYPYCKTVITNPAYMGKEKMSLTIETWHKADRGELHNVHDLPPEKLAKRDVVHIDIAHDKIKDSDYKADQDPKLVVSRKLQRGPLKDPNWKAERRVFTNFHRQVYCWMDKWAGLTMEDIRAIEDKTKKELEDLRLKGELKGTVEK
ncbi:phosphatidylinositol transfer protein beta isoform-like isoform X2 [Acanthaster planci]|uniref:Phosphatidylinositol transfer protein beta isoform-like isoform X2 n=1 Tax=Acanthaster planci TaxID=133434 RepID=A0A8B7YSN5_ACAPL|nr:phosphatidylinositol transfer protein beta isoform-like isoform X2 [Acanthaster planci]